MAKVVEYNLHTGMPSIVIKELNRSIGQYKRHWTDLKIGITGRDPNERFSEQLENYSWSKMVVLYRTSSQRNANILEKWLIETHQRDLINQKPGGGSELAPFGHNYLYILLR